MAASARVSIPTPCQHAFLRRSRSAATTAVRLGALHALYSRRPTHCACSPGAQADVQCSAVHRTSTLEYSPSDRERLRRGRKRVKREIDYTVSFTSLRAQLGIVGLAHARRAPTHKCRRDQTWASSGRTSVMLSTPIAAAV